MTWLCLLALVDNTTTLVDASWVGHPDPNFEFESMTVARKRWSDEEGHSVCPVPVRTSDGHSDGVNHTVTDKYTLSTPLSLSVPQKLVCWTTSTNHTVGTISPSHSTTQRTMVKLGTCDHKPTLVETDPDRHRQCSDVCLITEEQQDTASNSRCLQMLCVAYSHQQQLDGDIAASKVNSETVESSQGCWTPLLQEIVAEIHGRMAVITETILGIGRNIFSHLDGTKKYFF